MLTQQQIKALADSDFAFVALRKLLQHEGNVELLESLACEDIAYARWCDRNKIWTPSRWREPGYNPHEEMMGS